MDATGPQDIGAVRDLVLGLDAQNLYAATDQGLWRLRLGTYRPPSSTGTPTPTLLITELEAVASPTDYSGPCPAAIDFISQISVNLPFARLTYRWLRSDGATGPESSLNFNASGSTSVHTTWSLAGQTQFAGWEALQILSPIQATSNQANFAMTCQSVD